MLDPIRPNIRAMTGYVPGEQPRDGEYIKLNTNENPYPPSPRVFEALRANLTGDRLRKYPDPVGTAFRQTASQVLSVDPDGILIGNGSDDILTILTRAFVPDNGLVVSPTPSYLLYRTLAELQNARLQTVPYLGNWDLPIPWPIRGADLLYVANPNSPSGSVLSPDRMRLLREQAACPLVVDEAYADFAESNCLDLVRSHVPYVVVTRSLSKSYCLAGIRFGFAVAEPSLVHELIKVKDSYNCDVLSLAAAEAALGDQEYLQEIRAKVNATRERLSKALSSLGFQVTPSAANFVWCWRTDRPVKPIFEELKKQKILVRYMVYEAYGDGLRISVGTDGEIDRLLEEMRRIV